MLDLRQIILSDIASAPDPKSVSAQKKQECLSNIDAFIGPDTPLDCLRVISTGWLDAFERYVTTSPVSKKGSKPLSPATAAFRKKTLVAYCRDAIKQYRCPNIRIIPSPDALREIELLSPQPRHRDLEHLLSLFYHKMERCKSAAMTAPVLATLTHQTRAMAYAILGVLLCGIGYSRLAKIIAEPDTGPTIYLPHLSVTVVLPPHILSIIQWLRTLKPDPAPAIEQAAMKAIATASLAFADGFRDPFTQWIEIALEQGKAPVTYADARLIIDRLYAPSSAAPDSLAALVQRAFDGVISSLRNFSYSWYCIRSTVTPPAYKGRKDDAPSAATHLLSLIEADAKIRPVDTFAPRLTTVRDRDGKKELRNDPFLDTLLFLKVNCLQLEAVNRHLLSIRGGFIYGTLSDSGMTYSPISEAEIDILRAFFSRRASRKARSAANQQLQGRQAQILTGIYGGYDGTIVKVVTDKEKNITRLILKLQGVSAEVTYTVDPDYVEIKY